MRAEQLCPASDDGRLLPIKQPDWATHWDRTDYNGWLARGWLLPIADSITLKGDFVEAFRVAVVANVTVELLAQGVDHFTHPAEVQLSVDDGPAWQFDLAAAVTLAGVLLEAVAKVTGEPLKDVAAYATSGLDVDEIRQGAAA